MLFFDTIAGRICSRAMVAAICVWAGYLAILTHFCSAYEHIYADLGMSFTTLGNIAFRVPYGIVLGSLTAFALGKEFFLPNRKVTFIANVMVLAVLDGLDTLFVNGVYAPLLEKLK